MTRVLQIGLIAVSAVLLVTAAYPVFTACAPEYWRLAADGKWKSFSAKGFEGEVNKTIGGHDSLLTVGGGFCRALGRKRCKNVERVADGDMLVFAYREKVKNAGRLVNSCVAFNNYLRRKKVPFLFVMVPYKMDLAGKMAPRVDRGVTLYSDAERFLTAVAKADVRTLDLTREYAADVEAVKKYFYRTDHHWNGDVSLPAAKRVAEEILVMLKERPETADILSPDKWERRVLPPCWIGSMGRNVGPWFAGMDELIYYTPRFETDLDYSVADTKAKRRGSYAETCLFPGKLEFPDKGLLFYNPYLVHGGSDYGRAYIHNRKPLVKKRILLIKDSFALPVMCHLATIFEDIVVVDPRLETETAKVAAGGKFDLVVELINAVSLLPQRGFPKRKKATNWAFFDYGLEEEKAK